MHTSDKTLVETIVRSKIFREYEAAFHAAVGLPLALTPVETWGLPLHENRNESPFCRLMAQTNQSCAACLEVQATLAQKATEGVASVSCAFGLCDSAVPVKLGARLVGFLRTGQIFTHAPTDMEFQKTMSTLTRWGIPVQESELRAAYFATKVLRPEQYQAILRLLKLFAEQLGSLTNQILVSEETAENPQISHAKDFIAQNLQDGIKLADAAHAAHMSTFYFCKTFKRATGLSFTEYLSRLRTEKAKARLLDPHVRVSEVAFEVGFQSLSQFNRVFRKVTGQSPTDYRRAIPSGATHAEHSSSAAGAARRFKFGVSARALAAERASVAAR